MPEARPSRRALHALDELHEAEPNFDPRLRADFASKTGWLTDRYGVRLPSESPGPPSTSGSWAIARRVIADYEFADPSIVRAVYYPDEPLQGRTMLLIGFFWGLRFDLGVRIGGVIDETKTVGGHQARVWGWNYHTLQGHLEMGQIDYEVWKWLSTGDVEFRITVLSRPAPIPNPLLRLGHALFGRTMQKKFAHRALWRMKQLVEHDLATSDPHQPTPPQLPRTTDSLVIKQIPKRP